MKMRLQKNIFQVSLRKVWYYQGQQYGKKVFSEFMKIVKIEMQDIKRVELITRESNTKAIE